jgi:hypothetical protein
VNVSMSISISPCKYVSIYLSIKVCLVSRTCRGASGASRSKCVYIYHSINIQIHLFIYARPCVCMCVYVCVCVCMRVIMCVYAVYARVYVCVCVCFFNPHPAHHILHPKPPPRPSLPSPFHPLPLCLAYRASKPSGREPCGP